MGEGIVEGVISYYSCWGLFRAFCLLVLDRAGCLVNWNRFRLMMMSTALKNLMHVAIEKQMVFYMDIIDH